MRVVNSSRLWDNRNISRNSPYFLVPHMVAAGAVIGILLIVFGSQSLRRTPPAGAPSIGVKTGEQIPNTSLDKLTTVEQLLPEHYSPITSMLNELIASPPPPPPANCKKDACLALTFDDGPKPTSTGQILDVLQKENVKATFFLVGKYVAGRESVVKRIAESGNEIGNHSWSHLNFTKLKQHEIEQQINLTQTVITAATDTTPRLLRPPYGAFYMSMLKYVKMPVILWNVDPKDWAQPDSVSVKKIVERQARRGAIIVLHDTKITAGAVDKIIHDLKGKYRFVTVTQLLNLNDKSQGIFVGR